MQERALQGDPGGPGVQNPENHRQRVGGAQELLPRHLQLRHPRAQTAKARLPQMASPPRSAGHAHPGCDAAPGRPWPHEASKSLLAVKIEGVAMLRL